METKDIKELLQIMDEANLSAVRYDDGNLKIELERTAPSVGSLALPLMAEKVRELISSHDQSHVIEGAPTAPVADASADDKVLVRSPLVGTFYTGPSPDEDPFVQVGQEVLTGQTLAIVEAMKMMHEICAPAPGIVTEVLAGNGTQVEYDQPLFRIATEATA
ncbi:acetyl-CoA carboxylase biotin carboxyl carrier protein [Eggerthellaceae bacterium zg-1084]|uniref:Biotin carboxyl carrier protein of acetyl-CoA carboxylase n=1 Tax=Berryella wangjianweii TaxID=2734634 RepID=A0A6M8J2J2_9ACTN|nr:acetyl-CoA carboxylase biotin carboxyl carrier protein [Berryella wangjianweii]NPD31548.1 acetyl-CoA carboxylase biotin carboxyl carrier protein [Berryella wangjianweii]NPD32957.1 acetyl-CoA carboxylase biotin carboxyl carrier protein [Eggerthellaceae bacterium zg-997]QKF07827.1 acetyl-CoA carboxylase biotin carboxyl carrier protein [Berryella wangjianweii]